MTHSASFEYEINAPIEAIWAYVRDFGSLLKWVNGGDQGSISLSGEGVGMLRDFVLPSVGSVQHRLDALDPDRHLMTYTLTRGHPLGMASYSVTLELTALDAKSCRLDWTAAFEPTEGADAAQMAEGLRGAYLDMSSRLAGLTEG